MCIRDRPYTAFAALRRRFEKRPFSEWPEAYRRYRPGLLSPEDAREAEFFAFCQYRFDRTLRALRTYANEKGVRLIGDLPIYVSADSADLWAAPELFDRAHVAGVPPDFFSREGQRWGCLLYTSRAILGEGAVVAEGASFGSENLDIEIAVAGNGAVVEPVSYTHLDVYKRQAGCCATT